MGCLCRCLAHKKILYCRCCFICVCLHVLYEYYANSFSSTIFQLSSGCILNRVKLRFADFCNISLGACAIPFIPLFVLSSADIFLRLSVRFSFTCFLIWKHCYLPWTLHCLRSFFSSIFVYSPKTIKIFVPKSFKTFRAALYLFSIDFDFQ